MAEAIALWADRAGRVPARVWWAIAAAWYGLIFGLSAAPGLDAVSTESLLDMIALGDLNGLLRLLAHMSLFGVLAVWLYLALRPGAASEASASLRGRVVDGGRPPPAWLARRWFRPDGLARQRLRWASAVLLSGLLGASDELHQRFVPARHGRLQDVLYDGLGAVVVLTAAVVVVRWARRVRHRAQMGGRSQDAAGPVRSGV